MAVGTSIWSCAVVVILLIKNTQLSQATNHADCGYIKHYDHKAKSGIYTIAPPGVSPFKVYCDMSESIGWTKILQIATPYTVTQSGFGIIATEKCFDASAKLSDARINAIREERQKVGEKGVVHYRLTAGDTDLRVYAKVLNRKFNDLKAAWGIFNGRRQQCMARRLEACTFQYKSTKWHTLDTLHDKSQGTQTTVRFFTDHDGGNTKRKCWIPNSPKRCVSTSGIYGHAAHYNFALWIGK